MRISYIWRFRLKNMMVDLVLLVVLSGVCCAALKLMEYFYGG